MISKQELNSLLNRLSESDFYKLQRRAESLTRQYFGRQVRLYTPLYLSNFCTSGCLYCGFNQTRPLNRRRLSLQEMENEMRLISSWGIEQILLLSGESRMMSSPSYLLEAVKLARSHFSSIGIEVYPLAEEEYRELARAGVDSIALYQETYNRERYRALHPFGEKSDYDFRLDAPLRLARAGIRRLSIGVLLGLYDPAEDIHALLSHGENLLHLFPGLELTFSFPRLVPFSSSEMETFPVSDRLTAIAICCTRLLFPRCGITLSTRESADFRDYALQLGVTEISAASRTEVGGYSSPQPGDVQFPIHDYRSVLEIISRLNQLYFDPIFTDWRWQSIREIDQGRLIPPS